MSRIGWVTRATATLAIASGLVLLWISPALAAQPANDEFADAQSISGFPASATGTTAQATKEAGEPVHGDPASQDESIWFAWESPASAAVTIDTCGTFFFSDVLAVYTGSSLAGLTRVNGYETHFGPNCHGHPSFSFDAVQGVTYRIAVVGGPVAGGPVALAIDSTPRPPHDDF